MMIAYPAFDGTVLLVPDYLLAISCCYFFSASLSLSLSSSSLEGKGFETVMVVSQLLSVCNCATFVTLAAEFEKPL